MPSLRRKPSRGSRCRAFLNETMESIRSEDEDEDYAEVWTLPASAARTERRETPEED